MVCFKDISNRKNHPDVDRMIVLEDTISLCTRLLYLFSSLSISEESILSFLHTLPNFQEKETFLSSLSQWLESEGVTKTKKRKALNEIRFYLKHIYRWKFDVFQMHKIKFDELLEKPTK
jgi:hypothetical protein